MGYQLGVDLGTTFPAFAVHPGQTAEMIALSSRATSIPPLLLGDTPYSTEVMLSRLLCGNEAPLTRVGTGARRGLAESRIGRDNVP